MKRKHDEFHDTAATPSAEEIGNVPETTVNVTPEAVFQRPPPTAVYGRVKVKLKTAPKPPAEVVVDAPNKEINQAVDEKVDDNSNKSEGIKIVSSDKEIDEVLLQDSSLRDGKEEEGKEEENKKVDEIELKVPQREAKYNKQELEASLEVIKKIMKMDAAEPFNVPVDPIELGIPDYFEVIDTPMDFGTIRNNLEGGTKYMDSEDVYKDVQYIWDNCYKYNNKSDYIVDLMKRVKKNFMKYWVAAGLYTEQTKKTTGDESSPVDEPATSGHGKKFKKGKGVKRHKDDCLCAICIMKRRRREREAREAQLALEAGGRAASSHIKLPKTGLHEGYKQEIVHVRSPMEDTSSYMETSADGDADVEMEDGEVPDASVPKYNNGQRSEFDRTEFRDRYERSGDILEKSVQSDKGDIDSYTRTEAKTHDDSGCKMNAQKQPSTLPEGQNAEYMQKRHELMELEKKRQKQRMLETFRDLENPMLLGLCGMLFPNNVQSVWSGANSLIRRKRSSHRGEIHEAVSSFMNLPCKSASSLK